MCVGAQSLRSCLTLCDPMDYRPPGSSVHGILQARILEWVPLQSCPPPGNLPNPVIKQINTALQFQKKMYFLKNWLKTALFFYTHTRTHTMFFSIILNTLFCFDFQYALLVELGLVKKACFYHLCFIATNKYVPECFFFYYYKTNLE